jgi:hypothetical protein
VLLLENVKVGLSNLRVDAEGEVDVALKNILRLLQNAMMDRKSMEFYVPSPTNQCLSDDQEVPPKTSNYALTCQHAKRVPRARSQVGSTKCTRVM